MSSIVNDSVAKQIERGEVFFNSLTGIWLGSSGRIDILIEVGAADTSYAMYVNSEGNGDVGIYKSPTGASGTGSLENSINMNFASTKTISTTMEYQVTPATVGAFQFVESIIKGTNGEARPLATESGIILAANTDYLIRLSNTGPNTTLFAMKSFLREL